MQGKLIVIEGGNGAGKTTIMAALKAQIETHGCDVITTKEPGGTPISDKIRSILLDKDTPEMEDVTEMLLFAASRAQHVRQKIRPAMAEGKVVLSDRFEASTYAFQHYGRGIPYDLIKTLNDIATEGLKPDLTILLDLDPELGLQRVRQRGDPLDRIETARLDFLNKARMGYLVHSSIDPDRFVVIDASQSMETVLAVARTAVSSLLKS